MKTLVNKSLFVCAVLLCLSVISVNAQKKSKYLESYNYLKGIEAIEGRDYEKAHEAFDKEIELHPENGYAHLYLAHIYQYEEEYGKALASVNTALKYIPKKDKKYKATCYYKRAGIYRDLSKNDEALADYTTALSYLPSGWDFLWERAQIYYEQEKYDLADADYMKMREIDGDSPMPVMGLGRNEIARENYQSAIDLLDNVVALYPNYTSGYSFRAEAYIGLKKYIDATSDIVKALELDYDDKAFGLMIELADSAFVQINAKLKAMAVNDSNNSYWPYCLGVVNEEVEKYEDAITHYTKSAKLDEDYVTYHRISSCYEEMGDWTSAIEAIDKAIALAPELNKYLLNKADIYYSAGQITAAVEVMDEYVENVPDYAYGYYKRAWFKDALKEYDAAVEDYTTSITLEPEFPSAILSRGTAYLAKGESELAKKDFETVVQLDTVPEYGSVTMYALMHLGRNDEAIEWMDKMLETSDEEGVCYEATCMYSMMGEVDKALEYFEESLKRGNKEYHHIMADDDIDNIRETEKFKALMDEYFPQEAKKEESTDTALVEYTEKVVEVPFTRIGGVTQVKCSVNELPLHFIFDTGAADVTISRVEATFMFKNGYLTPNDVVGKARYTDANGDVSIGTVLNIKKITFGGLVLENVRASVVETNNAPLLLGQSVLNRLGKIEIDYDRSVLKITTRERK